MADVLVQFDTAIRAKDGTMFTPRVCTRRRDDGLWEGWVEFIPADTDERDPLRTGRETEQPNRDDVAYWAGGLTAVYLQGALDRALALARRPGPPNLAPRHVDARPYFDGPAPG